MSKTQLGYVSDFQESLAALLTGAVAAAAGVDTSDVVIARISVQELRRRTRVLLAQGVQGLCSFLCVRVCWLAERLSPSLGARSLSRSVYTRTCLGSQGNAI